MRTFVEIRETAIAHYPHLASIRYPSPDAPNVRKAFAFVLCSLAAVPEITMQEYLELGKMSAGQSSLIK